MPMFSSPKQRRETSRRIEVRKAKPVDRTLFRNQGCSVAVANHRVIFDRYGQELPSANQDRTEPTFSHRSSCDPVFDLDLDVDRQDHYIDRAALRAVTSRTK